MVCSLQRFLESLFNFCGFSYFREHRTPTKNSNFNYALLPRSSAEIEVQFEANGMKRPRGWSLLEKGTHSHSRKSPGWLSARNNKSRSTRWICLPRDLGGSVARPPPTAELKRELWIKNVLSQNGILAADNIAEVSQKYGEVSDVIGHGSSGVVFLTRKVQEYPQDIDSFYAVKVFRRKDGTSETDYRRRVEAEFFILSSLRHRNIVRTVDLLRIGSSVLCECLEYCSGGDLYSLLIETGQLKQAEADCFFKQLLHGVNYIHEMGVAHRDLKPENLLLTQDGCLKISDFGAAEFFRFAWENGIHMSRIRRGSQPYISPEQYLNKYFDPRSTDIWAAAMIYVVMSSGRIPWKIATADDEDFRDYLTYRKFGRGYFYIENTCHMASRQVIYSMLDIDDANRPKTSEILSSEWLNAITTCPDHEFECISETPGRIKSLSRSSGDRTNLCDWVRLRYRSGDIDGFRRLLTGYKLTISIALSDATLHQSLHTAEILKNHKRLIEVAQDDLEAHLESIDERLESVLGQAVAASERDTLEIQEMKEERLSTERCLQIWARLWEHIEQIHLHPKRNDHHAGSLDRGVVSEMIFNQGL